MGQTLSYPATDKTTEQGGNELYHFGVSQMQGWRTSMEDAHTVDLNVDEGQGNTDAFFAVYDGHGGTAAAKYAGENVHKRLSEDSAYRNKEYNKALKSAFLGTDEDMRNTPQFQRQRDSSGCTAVSALVTKNGKIFVANAGDSRSVLSVKGAAKPLSFDHKPQNESEKNRIVAAGGFVSFGRVNGNLSLARALGDFEFKKNATLTPEAQIITADPEITEHDITDDDEFLVIACDGIWDCLTSQQAVNVVRLLISQGKQLGEVCEEICDLCLAPDTNGGPGIGCDNMTILIVALLHGRTIDEWYGWITDRTHRKFGFDTPDMLPQLYSESRMNTYKFRRERYEENRRQRKSGEEKSGEEDEDRDASVIGNGFGGLAQMLGSGGRLSFSPSSGIVVHGPLMFDRDDDDSDGDMDADDNDMYEAMDLRADDPDSDLPRFMQQDMTRSLREQLDELERADGAPDGIGAIETLALTERDLQGEAPPPPASQQDEHVSEKQLESLPGGDAPSAAVKAEGFLDSSESPFKV